MARTRKGPDPSAKSSSKRAGFGTSRRPLALHRKLGAKHAFILITDPTAGRADAFTAYQIELFGGKNAYVIGREVSLAVAKRVVDRRIREDGA